MDLSFIKSLIESGDINKMYNSDSDSASECHHAPYTGYANRYMNLIDHMRKKEKTILIFAAIHNNIEITELLCNSGARLDIKTIDNIYYKGPGTGLTALHHAVINNNIEIVKLLIKHGVDINGYPYYSQQVTPVALAMKYNYHDIVKVLVDHGAERIPFM